MDSSEMKRFLTMLKKPSSEERESGIKSLTRYGKKNPEEVLIKIHKLIQKGQEIEKQAGYEIVGNLQHESSIPILLKKLTDNDPKIRDQASNAILKYEKLPKSLVSGLRKLIFHKRGEVKSRALLIVEQLKIVDAIDDLFLLARKERKEHPLLTREIYRILGGFKNLRAIPVLLEDSKSSERETAIQEIAKIYGKDKIEVFWAKTTETLDEVPQELFDDPDFLKALLEGINSTKEKIRFNSLYLYCRPADENQFDLIRSKLKDPSPRIREMVLKWLAKFEKKESGKELVSFLGDPEVSSTASILLEDHRWLESLVSEGLKSENSVIRGSSAIILTKLGEKIVVNDIIDALDAEKEEEIRVVFTKALGDLEDHRALPSLLDLTFSPNEEIIQTARDSLVKIGEISGLTKFLHSIDILSKTNNLDEIGKTKENVMEIVEVPEELICKLIESSDNEELRAAATEISGWREIHKAIDYLRAAIEKDESSLVRTKACEAIAFGGEEVITLLISYLPDADINVRKAVSSSLIKINRPLLYVESLIDPEDKIRLGLAEVLQEIRSSETIKSLREAVKKEQERPKTDQVILNAMILALGAPRDPLAINDILLFLKDPITSTRLVAVQALGEIADQVTIIPLLEVLDDVKNEVQEKALEALKAIGKHSEALNSVIMALQSLRLPDGFKSPETLLTLVTKKSLSLPLLHQVLDHPIENSNLRRGVFVVLGEIIDSTSIDYFFTALTDDEPIIREIITLAISKYDPEVTVKRLVSLLDSPTESVRWGATEALVLIAKEESRLEIEKRLVPKTEISNNVRRSLCRALGAIRNQESAKILLDVLPDPEPTVKIEAICSLGLIGNPIAFTPLFEREEDADRDVGDAATRALDQLSETCNIRSIVDNLREFRKDEEEIRLNASISLANLKEKTSSYLKEGLLSMNPRVRIGCIDALRQQKYTPAKTILETLTDDVEDKVRIAAIHALGEIGDQKSVEIIISHLPDKETRDLGEQIWSTGIKSLVSLNYIDPLLEKAHDSNKSIRWGILHVLGELRTGIDVILSLLEDSDEQVRVQASIASGQLEDTIAVQPLIEHLATDPRSTVRINSAKALGQIGDIEGIFALLEGEEQKKKEVVIASSEALNLLGKTAEEKNLVSLLKLLKKEDEEIRNKSITQLVEINESKKFLRQFLSATNHLLRASSILALVRAEDSESIPKFRELLSDKDKLVRACSAEALGVFTDVDAVPLLMSHLKDKKEDMTVRTHCSNSLASIGSPSLELLVEALTSQEHNVVRRLSAQALKEIADPESIKPLITFGLRDKDEEVRQASVDALIRIGEQVIDEISSIQEDKRVYARKAAVRVLGEIGSVQAMRKLEVAMNDGDVFVRELAGKELGRIGLPAVKSLCRCLASPRKETARQAAQILLDLTPTMKKEGDFYSVRFLRSSLQKRDKELQATACQALGILGDKNTVKELVSMLGSKHENVRLAAVKSLGIMNDGRAIPPLEHMLNDKNVEIRIAATEALEQLDKQGIESQMVEELVNYVKKPSGIKRVLSKAITDRGSLLETISSDIEGMGLEDALEKGVKLKSEVMVKAEKEVIDPLKELKTHIQKLQQLEKLRSQAILKEEEFMTGREAVIKDITEIIENLPLSKMNPEEIGTILEQLTELNNSGVFPLEDFEGLRKILVKELIS